MSPEMTRRQRQAAATKRDIVVAARRLFAEHGYGKTSVAEIAQAADVSVQTIYDSLGSKAAIVSELNDLIDEEGGLGDIVPQLRQTQDPRTLIELGTRISRNICERCGDIVKATIAASAVEPELAAVYAESMRRHREGVRRIVERLAANKALAKGVSPEYAGDVLGALTEPPVVYTFVDDYGWTFDQWHRFVTDTVCNLILKSP